MKKTSLFILSLFLTLAVNAADLPAKYVFTLDLVNVKEDKIMVTLTPPVFKTAEVVYNIPKMVPGTYSVDNFGKYVSDFKAFDKSGNELTTQKLDDNRWRIAKANTLDKITYWVDDTFEAPKSEHQIFEPTGTNIEANRNFLVNTHGFMGYFDNLKRLPYEVTYQKPQNFYGSSALDPIKRTATSETYAIPTYMELVDSPVMFTQPDTIVLKVGGAKILISVYSPNKKVTSAGIAPTINEILEAQKNYLGGKLPVQKYAFLVYLADKPNNTGSYGALEHSYSSVYYMPERENAIIATQIRSIAAHEFFHIVTPLNIHAEQIGDFDFNNPEMSKHLWLYEGTTEYAATHVQANQKLISPEEYLTNLRSYIIGSERFNDTLPFTVMSKGALDKYEPQYGNVYQKGALIGLALDIKLRELSSGKYGLRNLMVDLSKTYGKDKSFKDDELFDKIATLTYPEVRDFFRKYVEGPNKLPYAEIFNTVGITYIPVTKEKRQTYGGIGFAIDKETSLVTINNTDKMNAFGKKMKFKTGDQIIEINGQKVTRETAGKVLPGEILQGKEGSKITMLVNRKNKKGEIKPVKLKGKLLQTEEDRKHVLKINDQATPQQKIIRDAWLFTSL